MGLIQHAEIKKTAQTDIRQTKKKKGLLDRIVSLSPYDSLKQVFLDILEETHGEKGFFLYPNGERYQVVIEHGFDMTSSVRMIPETVSFHTLCSSSEGCHFSGTDLHLFSSFFSTRERSGLQSLAVIPVLVRDTVTYILSAQSTLAVNRMPLSTDVPAATIDSFKNFLEQNKSLLVALSALENPVHTASVESEKMHSAFADKRIALALSVSFNRAFPDRQRIETDYNEFALYRAIVNKIARQAGPASIIRKKADYSLRVLIFAAAGTDPDLYCNQMKKTLEKLFGAARVAAISLIFEGSFRDPDQAGIFLDGMF